MQIGSYKLISELGLGGMAQAWLAHRIWDDGERRSCVLKMPRRKAVADEGQMRQFVQEGRISKKLRHRNIPSVFDEGVHEGLPYLVMDFIAGVDLERLHLASTSAEGPWDIEPAIHVVREIGHALQYAHGLEERIIHRDVSAKNIMVDGEGGVLLMDFGIATSLHSMTSRLHVKGTLSYMAPEHYLGQACPASDVFGLGVIFWELLSGRRYRAGLDGNALGKAIVEGRFEPLGRDVPPEVRHVLKGMLESRPEDRTTLVEVQRAFKRSPNCSDDLKDMLALYFGRAGKRTGLSTVHFAASKELVDTLAVAKAAGVSMEEVRKVKPQGKPSSVPLGFEPEPVGRTSSVDPPAVATALDDDQESPATVPSSRAQSVSLEARRPHTPAAVPDAAGATVRAPLRPSVPSPPIAAAEDGWSPSGDTLRNGDSAGAPAPKSSATVRLDPGRIATEADAPRDHTVDPTVWLTPPAADPLVPEAVPTGMNREPSAPVQVDWQPSPPREVTSPPFRPGAWETEPHTSSEEGLEAALGHDPASKRTRSPPWLALALATTAMVAVFGVLAWWGVPARSETQPGASRSANAAEVGVKAPRAPDSKPAEPRASLQDETDESDAREGREAEPLLHPVLPMPASPRPEERPEPSLGSGELDAPVEPPAPEVPDDPEPSSPEPKAEPSSTPPTTTESKPKRAVVKLDLVVRRGLAVDFAELRVGRGKIRSIPARGAATLRVPAGKHTLRYRTKDGGPWQSSRYTFSPGMKYAGHIERSGLRIDAAPNGAR